jgi:hypothetical protein
MSEYRAFLLDAQGRISNCHELQADDDQDALDLARMLAVRCDVEVWALDRMVGKVTCASALSDGHRTGTPMDTSFSLPDGL